MICVGNQVFFTEGVLVPAENGFRVNVLVGELVEMNVSKWETLCEIKTADGVIFHRISVNYVSYELREMEERIGNIKILVPVCKTAATASE
ncbi:MAG TPA: hypothetical protein DCS07_02230 [Bdellovibrionales bacterium]|nr:hypothetical protein [Bdellovibrionales bacterium]